MEQVGIGGFTSFANVKQQETTTATAPGTTLEDGSFANDHIINNPVQIGIEGRVTDVFIRESPDLKIARRTLAEVGNITKYTPARTQSQIQRIVGLALDVDNFIKKRDAVIADGKQALDFFGSKDETINIRSKFIEMLEGYHSKKLLMRIETPTRIFENMVITSRTISRDATGDVIDFKISAVQVRFATTLFSKFKSPAPGSVSDQVKGEADKGLNDSPKKPQSLVSWLIN